MSCGGNAGGAIAYSCQPGQLVARFIKTGMIEFIKNWFRGRAEPAQALPTQDLRQSGANRLPAVRRGDRRKTDRRDRLERPDRPEPPEAAIEPTVAGRIDSSGPMNVLVRNKYQREDSGTHETLRIIDDSLADPNDEAGNDPYNSGSFDRSRNWEKRYRKK